MFINFDYFTCILMASIYFTNILMTMNYFGPASKPKEEKKRNSRQVEADFFQKKFNRTDAGHTPSFATMGNSPPPARFSPREWDDVFSQWDTWLPTHREELNLRLWAQGLPRMTRQRGYQVLLSIGAPAVDAEADFARLRSSWDGNDAQIEHSIEYVVSVFEVWEGRNRKIWW
jgi:hypothetical protein